MEDRRKYIHLLNRYAWLIVLAAVLAGAIAFVVRSIQPNEYKAEARIFIGDFGVASPDRNALETSALLAITYSQLITRDMLADTIAEFNLPFTIEEFSRDVGASTIDQTPILLIEATYTDPQIAADIANSIANRLMAASPVNLDPDGQDRLASIREQIAQLENQIVVTDQQAIEALLRLNDSTARGTDEGCSPSGVRALDPEVSSVCLEIQSLITQRQNEYNRLIDQLNTARSTLAQLNATYLQISDRNSRLEILQVARPPQEPTGLRPIVVGLAGAVGGAIFAAGVVLFYAYIDTSIRTLGDLERRLDISGLGTVRHFGKNRLNPAQYLVVSEHSDRPIGEDFKEIRTRIWASAQQTDSSKVYVVTSTNEDEGKSFVVSNLAASLALSGMRVLVVDAVLQEPTLHAVFGLDSQPGLADLLDLQEVDYVTETAEKSAKGRQRSKAASEAITVQSANDHNTYTFGAAVHQTSIENLWLLPVGNANTSSAERMGSRRMSALVSSLFRFGQFDFIFIDAPAATDLSSAAILAAIIPGNIIFVSRAGRVQHTKLETLVFELKKIGVHIEGVILNQVRGKESRRRSRSTATVRQIESITTPGSLALAPEHNGVPQENSAAVNAKNNADTNLL